MNIRSFTLFLASLLLSIQLYAQCPPPGFPEPGNTCPDAPILCENLDGYCATINNNNVVQQFACCGSGWTLNNDEWFGFFAGSSKIVIEVVPQNCTDGPLKGLQGAIYAECPGSNPNGAWCSQNSMDIQCPCTEDPFTLSASTFVVGQVYWIVLDGCNGLVCDYTINVLEGTTIGFPPAAPGPISGQDTICNKTDASYSIATVDGATQYFWTLHPSNAGTVTSNGHSATVDWSDTFHGAAQICVAASNECYSNPVESCYDVLVSADVDQTYQYSLCPGDSVTILGQVFTQSGTLLDTIHSNTGCDTFVTHIVTLLPYFTRSESISFCPGKSVNIGGQLYNQPGTVVDTIASANACDTIVTYTLSLLPYNTRSESIAFCPGKSVNIGGQLYNQPGTVVDTLASANACDTIVTYTLSLLPYNTRSENIAFCPGTAVQIGGQSYHLPGTVIDTLVSSNGCDTIVTYTLAYSTPAASNVQINCPASVMVQAANSNGTTVQYNQPTASSDCICPGVSVALTSGLASGSQFMVGQHQVCFTARDSCGQTANCCFQVNVEYNDDGEPCDTKISGCLKYELLSITEDMFKNRTYRIQVTNQCANKLLYTAIQLPNGIIAIDPPNLSTYLAPSGHTYKVRNPNFSPQYSIRFSSLSDSIRLGGSDIFKYTLPAQAQVTFIHLVTRLEPSIYLEAQLNTFNCPIGVTPTGDRGISGRDQLQENEGVQVSKLRLVPNPATQFVRVETDGQPGTLILQDAMGRTAIRQSISGADAEFSVETLPQGLYQVFFVGEKTMQYSTLVVQH